MLEMLPFFLIAIIILYAAIRALRAEGLLMSALWLAAVSAAIATMIYMLSANQVAVIELSVGAGLVTILLIFAIGVAGDEPLSDTPVVPRVIAGFFVLACAAIISFAVRPFELIAVEGGISTHGSIFMQGRDIDLLVQVVVIFSGVLGLVGILAEARAPLDYPVAGEVAARRDQELLAMEQRSEHIPASPDSASKETLIPDSPAVDD
ncbi:MAG: hypothetical protein P1P76_06675 [Anaerolineales bacterium]|nr:hypothetical protein [Anaerolineales bacterium]